MGVEETEEGQDGSCEIENVTVDRQVRSKEKLTGMTETDATNGSLQNTCEHGSVAIWEALEGDVARAQATCLG